MWTWDDDGDDGDDGAIILHCIHETDRMRELLLRSWLVYVVPLLAESRNFSRLHYIERSKIAELGPERSEDPSEANVLA